MAEKREPNLFIIGAMKAGTTSLHGYLATHPDIFMSNPKEPGFFVDRTQQNRPTNQKTYWNDLGCYLELFAAACDRAIIGESTTDYTKLPQKTGVAKRIYEFNPTARLIYLMRDPIARTISHYWWNVQTECETRDILTAIHEENFYRDVSDYAMQLEPYLELFGREQIQAITFEELTANPQKVLQELFAWLGVDQSFVPPNVHERMNETPEEVTQIKKHDLMQHLRTSKLWNAVGPFTPRVVRSVGRRLVERRIDRSNIRLDSVVEFLRPIQQEQAARLSKLLHRDFPEWTQLYGCASANGCSSQD